ncbi:Transcriptional regulator of RNA polII, SAGA, subunit [Nakaseomyces glabratus]|nr:Transcriptional regulator of RNA polII, SAGA, subunit [Nakaseomyces glabratus]KAH7591982.1 Transcriptional regulator of RNA polII, SAGA, subunit [Nakaseomyces glabratus]
MTAVQPQMRAMTPSFTGSGGTLTNGNSALFVKNAVGTPISMIDSNQLNDIPSAGNYNSSNLTSNLKLKESLIEDQRVDISSMIEEITGILGRDQWTKYAQILSLFILGKLSRKELVNELDILFSGSNNMKPKMMRLHNHLLLGILANSLRENPLIMIKNGSWGFGNGTNANGKQSKKGNKHNSQIELYKKIVMSLPIEDRNRIKSITKDAGKRGFVFCSVLQSRLNNIPKIPIVTNADTLKRIKNDNMKTPLEWSQDIMNGFGAPLASESYSLPDTDSFYLRIVGIAREHGIVGNIDAGCIDLISLALDVYLKNIIEMAIDTVRYRKKKYSDYYDLDDFGTYQAVSSGTDTSKDAKDDIMEIERKRTISLTNEDIYTSLSLFPNMADASGAYYNAMNLGLVNDDELVIKSSSIDDLPDFLEEKPFFTPVDEKNIGTPTELNWLIRDILTEN